MYQGKHSSAPIGIPVRKKRKNIRGALSAALILTVIVIGCAASIAYLTSTGEGLTNTFTPSSVDCEIVEDGLTPALKPSATVKNTEDTDAYIRVVVIGNEINAQGEIIDSYDVSSYLKNGSDLWNKAGEYYYYGAVVPPQGVTNNIINAPIPLSAEGKLYQVIIQAEAIQAEPYFTPEGGSGEISKPVYEAWGVSIQKPANGDN